MHFHHREPFSRTEHPHAAAGNSRTQSDPVVQGETDAAFELVAAPHIEVTSIEPLMRSDEMNGVWRVSAQEAISLRAAVRGSEFQVACLSDTVQHRVPAAQWAGLSAVIAQQIFLRREWYTGDVPTSASLPNRAIRDLQRVTGISAELADEIRQTIDRWIGAFAAVTESPYARISLMSERGPRRLELEGDGTPISFHVDDSGLRLVAPIVGPTTNFVVCGKGESIPRRARTTAPTNPLHNEAPFDLDQAVQASFQRFIAPVAASYAGSVYRAPDRNAILFPGTRSCAERPLLHAAPHPRTAAETNVWARLLLTIDLA